MIFLYQAIIKSLKNKYLFIFGICTLALLLCGYRFGTFDQNFHLPFLFKTANPSLYPNNPYFDLRFFHYSFFWFLFLPFLKLPLIDLEIIMFLTHYFTLFLLFIAFYKLIFLLTSNSKISLIGLFAFIIPAYSFSANPVFEWSLLNRSFALPFLVFSLIFFIQKRFFLAFIILGIMYNFHAISANFVLVMFICAAVINYKKIGLKKIILPVFIFNIFSLPVIIWKMSTLSIDLSVHDTWFSIIDKGALGFYFHLFSFDPPVIIFSLLGIANTAIFIYLLRKKKTITYVDKNLIGFFVAIYFILLIGVLSGEFLPLTFIIQLLPARVGAFIPILAFPYFIAFLYEQYTKQSLSKNEVALVIVSIPLSGSLIIPFLLFIAITKKKLLLKKLLVVSTMLITVLSFSAAVHFSLWQPGIFIYPQETTWYDVQIWAKEHTPTDAVFITPPAKGNAMYSDFFNFSERNTVVLLGELFEIIFYPPFITDWEERYEDVVPGAIDKFSGNFLENRDISQKIYTQNTQEDFERLVEKYHASYVIVEKPQQLQFKQAYENKDYYIYFTQDL